MTYATLGYGHVGTGNAVLPLDGVRITYDSATNRYRVSTPNSTIWQIDANLSAPGSGPFIAVAVRDGQQLVSEAMAPRPGALLNLTYSSLLLTYMGDPWNYGGASFLAFGVPTPIGGTPITGTARYQALAFGETLSTISQVRGSAQLDFDFAAATLTGFFDPVLVNGTGETALPRESFTGTVFARGALTFSGSFAGLAGSTFNGQFTGPQAEELIARFQQPVPGSNDTMVGVWVGKR